MAKKLLLSIAWGWALSFVLIAEALALDKIAPACILPELDSPKPLALESLRGKVLYVDFWASWCPPCLKSFPFLNDIHQTFSQAGLRVVAINMDEDLADAREFLQKNPAEFTVLTDPDSRCAESFEVKAMPSSYLIDRKGVIRQVELGFRPDAAITLKQQIKTLLNEP